MSDPTQPERGSEQPSEGLPIPKLETPSQASPSSVDTDAIVKQVEERLRREIRQAQSMKDKETAAANKKLGIDDLSELEAMGATIPENVKTEYRFRQLETQRGTDNSPARQAPSPGNGAELTATDVSEVVKNYQLDANQPEVLEALRSTYRNRDHFEATMARLAMAKTKQPQPTPAESGSLQAPPPAGGTDLKGLQAAYEKRRDEIAQTQRGDAKIKALSDLKVEYRGRGLNI